MTGLEKAWFDIESLEPAEICRNAGVEFIPDTGIFTIPYFTRLVLILPEKKELRFKDDNSIVASFDLSLSLLIYLSVAKENMPSCEFVLPSQVPGGGMFYSKHHTVPSVKITERIDSDIETFKKKCFSLGGEIYPFGDYGFKFRVFPRAEIAFSYWKGDEDFPSETTFLFEKKLASVMPPDALWALAKSAVKTITT